MKKPKSQKLRKFLALFYFAAGLGFCALSFKLAIVTPEVDRPLILRNSPYANRFKEILKTEHVDFRSLNL